MSETEKSNEIARQQISEMREQVEKNSDQATGRRPCPNCNHPVILHCGRVSNMWFFKHEQEQDCLYDVIGCSIFFKTRQEAIDAKEIFREPNL